MNTTKRFFMMAAAALSVTFNAGCKKTEKDDISLTLPKTIDFTDLNIGTGKTSFDMGGITFHGAYAGGMQDVNWEWNYCASPSGGVIRYQTKENTYAGITLAYQDFNALVADISTLPAISKVTVKAFPNSQLNVSVCDGNGVIVKTEEGIKGQSEEEQRLYTWVYTLNVGNKKAEKLVISSLESIIYSITIE